MYVYIYIYIYIHTYIGPRGWPTARATRAAGPNGDAPRHNSADICRPRSDKAPVEVRIVLSEGRRGVAVADLPHVGFAGSLCVNVVCRLNAHVAQNRLYFYTLVHLYCL